MTSEIYRKVGRGGAGNFYGQEEIDAAKAKTTEDLEAQTATSPPIPIERPVQDYAHTGRGGAGNWIVTAEQLQSLAVQDTTSTVIARRSRPTEYYGRGGAGNINRGDEERRKAEEERIMKEEQKRREAEVIRNVEMGLKPPERAYLGTSAKRFEDDT